MCRLFNVDMNRLYDIMSTENQFQGEVEVLTGGDQYHAASPRTGAYIAVSNAWICRLNGCESRTDGKSPEGRNDSTCNVHYNEYYDPGISIPGFLMQFSYINY